MRREFTRDAASTGAVVEMPASGYCRNVQWLCVLLFFSGAIAFAQPDDEIRRILSDRIERDHQSLGIVAGVIDGQGRRIVAQGDVRPDSLFEIGSVTKVFTALLLADMAERGEVALSDPVSKYLPEASSATARPSDDAGRPGDAHVGAAARPDESFAAHISQILRGLLPGEACTISWAATSCNVTPGRNGSIRISARGCSAMSSRAGPGWITTRMVRLRICGPLDMTSTLGVMTPELKPRAATGHNRAAAAHRRIGIGMPWPGPARCGRALPTCWTSSPRISGTRSPGWRPRWRQC